MPSASQIVRYRQDRRETTQNKSLSRLGLSLAVLFTLLLGISLIAIPMVYTRVVQDLPSLATLPMLLEPPDGLLLHPTLIFDRSGEHILQTVQNPAVEERRYLPISKETDPNAREFIAPAMSNATVAITDPTFWSHPGCTLEGISNTQPTSLAERLVSELLLKNQEPGWQGSLRECLLATQLIDQFGRPKILEWYLNSAYYGNLAYGVDAASQVYYGKPASELTLAEAALLTAIAEAPALNPLDAPEEALKRQKIVLEAMVAQGYITPAEAIEAAGLTLTFRERASQEVNPAQAYLNLVWEQLAYTYDLEQIERGGFHITTSLDYDLLLQANCARDALIARLEDPAAPIDPEACPAARLLPTLSIPSQALPADMSASIVVLEPETGQILVLLGDPAQGIDPAHLPGRPPGSMLTPFLYLTAFTRGFSPASLLWDVPLEIPGVVLPEIEQHVGPVRLRLALANDYLIPAIQMMSQVGADSVWRTTQELGLASFARYAEASRSSSCPGCALLLDGGEVTLLELTHAYSTFANQGLMVGQPFGQSDSHNLPPLHPLTVLKISDIHGKEWLAEPNLERRPVITQQLAYLITHILSDDAARWPGLGHPNALEIGRPAAAKIGGTSTLQDTWTIGYTPQTVVGIWVGNSDPASGGAVPSKVSAALWNAITQYATQALPPTAWEIPPGISFVNVCDPSGQLPTRHCLTVVSEVFLNGNEPTQFDSLYQASQINRETGLLATVFTPPELVEERVFMQLPAIASQWALENQIAIPPESYDVIAMPPILESAQIETPAMFSSVGGEIEIYGSASGDDFISYRLQAGQGLNPQAWIQISDDITTPVQDDLLATWDTGNLNGLFAIQMIVLRENRKVDTATIQVTIDNLPPEVSILHPADGQRFAYEFGNEITFRAEASDNIALKSVVFFLEGRELSRQSQPPFAVPWRAKPGEYTLRVEALDFAGNTHQSSIDFRVEE